MIGASEVAPILLDISGAFLIRDYRLLSVFSGRFKEPDSPVLVTVIVIVVPSAEPVC